MVVSLTAKKMDIDQLRWKHIHKYSFLQFIQIQEILVGVVRRTIVQVVITWGQSSSGKSSCHY